jgi:hypothetical protein
LVIPLFLLNGLSDLDVDLIEDLPEVLILWLIEMLRGVERIILALEFQTLLSL